MIAEAWGGRSGVGSAKIGAPEKDLPSATNAAPNDDQPASYDPEDPATPERESP